MSTIKKRILLLLLCSLICSNQFTMLAEASQNEVQTVENETYITVSPFSAYSLSNATTLESGKLYYREYSSDWHAQKWYSKFTIQENSYAYIGFASTYYYEVKILDADGITVYDFGSKKDFSGYFPLEAGTYYVYLSNNFSKNSVVLSYVLSEQVYCEQEPNDTFSTATELQFNQEYLIFSGQNGNVDYLTFNASIGSKIKIIVDNYEEVSPYMYLYEKDRSTYTLMRLKYDENMGKYYYEFEPKYNGKYYIETHSYKSEKVYEITVQCPGLAGWQKNSTGWWYQNSDGTYPKNMWKFIDNSWYYFNARGYRVENQWIDTYYYVGADGKMATNQWIGSYYVGSDGKWIPNYGVVDKWVQNSTGWWYRYADGTYPKSTWKFIDNSWYYFNARGYRVENQWIDTYYYVGADGKMATNQWIGSYYVGSDGKWIPNYGVVDKWVKNSTGWWYRYADGTYPKSTWKFIDNSWYYFNARGYRVENQWIDTYYYVGADGKMATNQWIGSYYVGSDGRWIPNKK